MLHLDSHEDEDRSRNFENGIVLKSFYDHQVFGWHLRSNIALPCQPRLEPGTPDCVLDVIETFNFTETNPAFSNIDVLRTSKIQTVWKNAAGDWRLEYQIPEHDLHIRVDVTGVGRRILVRYNQSKSLKSLPFMVLGSVLAACLWQAGKVCLHGGMVVSGGTGLMVMGASGAGKSSTLGALMQLGCPILTEDVVVLAPNDLNAPCGPIYLRLWSDSALALGFDPSTMPLVFQPESNLGEKRYLELAATRFEQNLKSVPLSHVFILAGRKEISKPKLTTLSPKDAVPQLMNNLYRGIRFDLELRSQQAFATCVNLAHQCRVSLVKVPANLERLPELADSLLEAMELVA